MNKKKTIFPPDINPKEWDSYTTKKRADILRKWIMKNDVPKFYRMITKEDFLNILNTAK